MCGNTSMQIRDAIIICQNVYLVHLSETISMKTWTPQVFCLFIMFALICQNFRKWKLFIKRRDEISKYKRVHAEFKVTVIKEKNWRYHRLSRHFLENATLYWASSAKSSIAALNKYIQIKIAISLTRPSEPFFVIAYM